MKKVLTFVLALVMVLAIAAPAMAFTGLDEKEDSSNPDFEIAIELVDYSAANFTRGAYYTELPAADRGYLKNEMVGAVVTLSIEDDAKGKFSVEGENVILHEIIAENTKATEAFGNKKNVNKIIDGGSESVKDGKFRYLVLGQLTGNSGSITAKMKDPKDSEDLTQGGGVEFGDYIVSRTGRVYTIALSNEQWMKITVDRDNKCDKMTISCTNTEYEVALIDGALGFLIPNSSTMAAHTKGEVFDKLKEVYDDICAEFGLSYSEEGYLYDSFFFNSGTVKATAYLEPYVSTITVPDVVVDPPKTGDASTLVGIVMVIIALAGVVVSKKVRA